MSEQIRIKKSYIEKQKEQEGTPSENPHARSESLLALYKKEKAKQLFQEQLNFMKQKKAFEQHVAEIDRQHSLERLIRARKEYVILNLIFKKLRFSFIHQNFKTRITPIFFSFVRQILLLCLIFNDEIFERYMSHLYLNKKNGKLSLPFLF